MIGVVDTDEAKRMATRAGLDLVEVSPDSDPPVCRILDYGKFRYDQAKKDRANRAKSKGYELKEIRFGRSMKIDPHDAMIRTNQARKFLMEGHKVQIVMTYRGREMMHRDRGMKKANEVIENLADISKVEMFPRQAGRRLTILLAPDKAKITRIKSVEAASAMKAEPADAAELKDPPSQDPVVDPPASPVEEPAVDAVDTGAQDTGAQDADAKDTGDQDTGDQDTVENDATDDAKG